MIESQSLSQIALMEGNILRLIRAISYSRSSIYNAMLQMVAECLTEGRGKHYSNHAIPLTLTNTCTVIQ